MNMNRETNSTGMGRRCGSNEYYLLYTYSYDGLREGMRPFGDKAVPTLHQSMATMNAEYDTYYEEHKEEMKDKQVFVIWYHDKKKQSKVLGVIKNGLRIWLT